MSTIFSEDFLLHTESAKKLYHGFAKELPIIDFHNHLPADQIADNKNFENLTQIWLKGDHYKWRAMRNLAIPEKYITGTATDWEKFEAWASCVPQTLRNPLFHWTHLELKNPFGISKYLKPESAAGIYDKTNALLQQPEFSTQGLLKRFNVEMICTTDDPCDDLMPHQTLSNSNSTLRMQPGFRPDNALHINKTSNFRKYIKKLSAVTGITIDGFESLVAALANRIDFFEQNGCRIADHGLSYIPKWKVFTGELDRELKKYINDEYVTAFSEPDTFIANLLLELCKIYHAKSWVQQFHLGPLRNTNSRLYQQIGADAGVDSIGDDAQAENLAQFLDYLDKNNQLAKTIIYNLNPAHNEVFASMTGNFNDGTIRGKIQYGSAWWFSDQLDGMEKQLNALSNIGLLSTFVGMLTDSRSFLSFPRHEYFRRLLCQILGKEMENGLLPTDLNWVGKMVEDICYCNAKNYFNL